MRKLARRALPPFLAFCALVFIYAAVHLALGTRPFAHSNYDSYTLQALISYSFLEFKFNI